jgi:hypothetical protein
VCADASYNVDTSGRSDLGSWGKHLLEEKIDPFARFSAGNAALGVIGVSNRPTIYRIQEK